MKYTGDLRKMRSFYDTPVRYELPLYGSENLPISSWLGKSISIIHTGEIYCKRCGRKTEKSFAQGFCYPCFQTAPENSECIINPELCEGHMGRGRDIGWERKNHVKPHVVYLAISSGLKVGVTREDQVPTRWIDQGAYQAIILAETPYRRMAGDIEVALKEHLSDKTAWQRMLKNDIAEGIDLTEKKAEVSELMTEDHKDFLSTRSKVYEFEYPVLEFPKKVKSTNLTKVSEIEGTLMGIKGQYLIFDEGRVLNIRSHAGFRILIKLRN
jgi:hypothetical protein